MLVPLNQRLNALNGVALAEDESEASKIVDDAEEDTL